MGYLWRAVDAGGEGLDVLVQSKRNKHAALNLMRKLLKKYAYAPAGWSRTTCGHTAQRPAISASSTCISASDGVESTTGAVAVGTEEWLFAGSFRTLPVPQFGPWLRFQSPLVKPDVRISRIRLSPVPSNLRSWQVAAVSRDGVEAERLIKILVRDLVEPGAFASRSP